MKNNNYKSIKKLSFFKKLEKKFYSHEIKLDITYYLPRLLYILFLGLVYIWNAHYHEKILYKIKELQPMVDALHVKHIRLQSSYMFKTKQSEISKKVVQLAIYESKVPPYIIKANKGSTIY